ncbi:hypothetical protein GQ457_16G030730 [Hibiscus cannabinus]
MASFNVRRSLSTLLSRALSSPLSSSSLSSRSRPAFALLGNSPLSLPEAVKIMTRTKTSGSGYSPLNDPSPNWSNRPPKETILLDGCDYEHWLIVLEFPEDPKLSEEEMVDAYVKTLASVVGSEEEAKKKIYSVCTTRYTGFGALISEELSYKVKGLPRVLWVLPDSYLDVPNKDYGGDLFVDGKVIRRPQYTGATDHRGRLRSSLPLDFGGENLISRSPRLKAEAYHPTDTTTAAAPPISFPKRSTQITQRPKEQTTSSIPSYASTAQSKPAWQPNKLPWTHQPVLDQTGPSGGNCSGIDIVNKSPNLFGDLVSSALLQGRTNSISNVPWKTVNPNSISSSKSPFLMGNLADLLPKSGGSRGSSGGYNSSSGTSTVNVLVEIGDL